MALRPFEAWLLWLSDPAGAQRPAPRRRLALADLRPLIDLAAGQGVLGIVQTNLLAQWDHCIAGQPADPAECERLVRADPTQRMLQGAVSALLAGQAERIATHLSGRSVPAVVLKGPDFAYRLYPNPAVRTYGDIDLLVSESAVKAAEAELAAMGLQRDEPEMKYAAGYGESRWRGRVGQAAYRVELHWNLINSPTLRRALSVRLEDLRLEPSSCQGGLPRPDAASLLLIAAVHAAAGHQFDRLLGLCDVLQAARESAGAIDADWLVDSIDRTGSARCVSAGLTLAGQAFNQPRCREWLGRLGLSPMPRRPWSVTPAAVLRSETGLLHGAGSLRRQILRQWLKGGRRQTFSPSR